MPSLAETWSQMDPGSSSVTRGEPRNSSDPVSSSVKWECAEYLQDR